MSIQYTVPGFKPMTIRTRASSQNYQTRVPPIDIFIYPPRECVSPVRALAAQARMRQTPMM